MSVYRVACTGSNGDVDMACKKIISRNSLQLLNTLFKLKLKNTKKSAKEFSKLFSSLLLVSSFLMFQFEND